MSWSGPPGVQKEAKKQAATTPHTDGKYLQLEEPSIPTESQWMVIHIFKSAWISNIMSLA